LPLVLVQDVAAALVRCSQTEGIDGRSYNLVDVPLLSAQEYLWELQRIAGIKLTVHYRSIARFYFADLLKWAVKLAVGHPDRGRRPSYRDWESRTQKAIFDCSRAREELGWAPSSDRQRMIKDGIGGSLKSWLEAVV
jgi:nucleoside-diphosphate-sugar epimerase